MSGDAIDYSAEGLYQGDCREVLADLAENSIDAVVTDGPYGLGFMGKKWDRFAPGQEAKRVVANQDIDTDNPNVAGRQRSPAASPSMIEYDRSLAGQREFQLFTASWAREAIRVLKPGGYLVSFGAPRSHHRMMSGIEDAGFEIRDTLMWLFGQGFPKSLNIARAVAAFEASGRSRPEDLRRLAMGEGYQPSGRGRVNYDHGGASVMNGETVDVDADATGAGWGTALKPAWEPIALARKPLGKLTVAECFLRYGTGGVNIGGCRVEGGGETESRARAERGGFQLTTLVNAREGEASADQRYTTEGGTNFAMTPGPRGGHADGRWPANLILDEAAAARLDAEVGERKSGARSTTVIRTSEQTRGVYGKWPSDGTPAYPADVAASTGGVSRYFYRAKVSRAEREFGCDDLPMRSAGEATGGRVEGSAGLNNPRAGAGRGSGSRNAHPTVKPIALMRWLVKLVTPPNGTILDPFVGSGSTGIAAMLEGVGFMGVDLEAEWLAVADARIRAWRVRKARYAAGDVNAEY